MPSRRKPEPPAEAEQTVAPDDPFAHCLRKRISKREAIRRWGKAARGWLNIWTDEGLWEPLHDFDLNFAGYGLGMPDAVPLGTDKDSLLDLRTDKQPITARKAGRFDPKTGRFDAAARAAILRTLPASADPDAILKKLETVAADYHRNTAKAKRAPKVGQKLASGDGDQG